MRSLLTPFRRRRAERRSLRRAAEALYRSIARQARTPGFYREGGVADTLDGRFDMLVLHLWLVQRRLARTPHTAELQRTLLELAITDFDRSLRELGVGDLGVGRRVRAMARAQAGRFEAYNAAILESDDTALRAALGRNVWRGAPPNTRCVNALASYVRRQHVFLEAQDSAALALGKVAFQGDIHDEDMSRSS